MSGEINVKLEGIERDNETGLQAEVLSCGGALNLSGLPVLEVTISHLGGSHTTDTGKKLVVYKAPDSQEDIVLQFEENSKVPQKEDETILIGHGENQVKLKKSVIAEYRQKRQYYGPLRAVVERATVNCNGQQQEILKTKLMQVKFVSKDSLGNDLKGDDLLQSMAKIPGLIPPCDPPLDNVGKKMNGSNAVDKKDQVFITFTDGDSINISKKVIDQYRKLSGTTKSLAVQREKTYRNDGSGRTPVTIVRLYPRDDGDQRLAKMEATDNSSSLKPQIGRPRAVRGQINIKTKLLQDCSELQQSITAEMKDEMVLVEIEEDTQQSQSEDEGLSSFGYETGIIVQTSPTYSASFPNLKELESCTEVSNDVIAFHLQSASVDVNVKLSSDEIWKYLTEYASECEQVQGLITQFNNESWLEVKRMSDFFHVDGEVMTDISIKAVYRSNPSPVTFYLRGFGRMIRSGELNTLSDITHLYRCLSSDHKLCLGLKPSPYQPDIENNEHVRQYFKSKGHFVSTPFESLFSRKCRGIVTIQGSPPAATFTRGSRTVMGVYALCTACGIMGKKLSQLIKTYPRNKPTLESTSSHAKVLQSKYNQHLTRQPLASGGSSCSSSQVRHLFSQNVAEVISSTATSSPAVYPDESHSSRLTLPRIKRKEAPKQIAQDKEEDEDSKPSVGVTEEEFLSMIDLRHPQPGVHPRSLIKKCNVCGFRAPSMLSLFSHMKGHIGNLKEKCGECKVQLSSKDALETHKKQMHTQRSPVCAICHLSFTTKDQLFDHMNKHRSHLPFECPVCQHKLTNMDAYKKHVRLTHKIKSVRDLKFVCRTCGLHFYTCDHLLLHRVNQNHEGEPFLCKSCGTSFTTANEFRSHLLEHTEEVREAANIAICQQCYKVFFSSFRLKFHIDAKHNQGKEPDPIKVEEGNEPPKKKKSKGPYLRYLRANEKYECHKCKRRFKTCDTLQNHIKYSHGEKKAVKTDNKCNICGRKFNALRRLANHMKIHTGTRPVFQCEECGQIYGKKMQVLEHIRTDHAEQVKRHQEQQQQQELLQSSQTDEPMVEITEQPQGPVVEGSTSAAWTPIKSPFKVPTVEQTQEAVYSLLQLTDF
ncbi:uncharacterized protein LOC127002734 isoform X1 [Eriocheir sinensis]|uniref:uncharacterized protein LOC127002734 isoform X1 n=1 Tax=Eriocheir sinensis TaxID=95602 RepID=UPI0021C6EF78|nr:uncharacterized protein LOC127002734 isoform X1 [Eriocheir sinensis]